MLLATFLLGVVGTGVELLLIGHTEDVRQLIPLALLAAAAAVLGWHGVAPRSSVSVQTFRGVMGLFLAAGALGLFLHYRGNVEFELEMSPGLAGLALVREALTGATPALAPGAMALLGLIGLAWTYDHPALRRAPTDP